MDDTLKEATINEKSDENFIKPDNPTAVSQTLIIDNKDNTVKETIEEHGKENADRNDNIDIENVYYNGHNSIKAEIKQEIHDHSSNNEIPLNNNSLSETINSLKPNDSLSYIREFEFFLKKYKEKYDHYSSCTSLESLKSSFNETEELIDDIIKHDNFEHTLDSSSSDENSESRTLARTMSDIDKNEENISRDDTYKVSTVEHVVISTAELLKPYNIAAELNDDEECLDGLHFDDKANKDITEETDNVISISSDGDLTKDAIHIDPPVNYSISLSNKTEVSLNVKLEADSDCEGYNSSDFEFIDEQEASLGGAINESGIISQSDNLRTNKIEENRDFSKPGPSRTVYSRKADIDLRFPSSDSESDNETNEHVIPEGENLYELFAEPPAAYNYEAENKCFISNRAMYLDFDNFSFNLQILHRRHEENELDNIVKEEAVENARKILMMYPVENTRRRRRH